MQGTHPSAEMLGLLRGGWLAQGAAFEMSRTYGSLVLRQGMGTVDVLCSPNPQLTLHVRLLLMLPYSKYSFKQ